MLAYSPRVVLSCPSFKSPSEVGFFSESYTPCFPDTQSVLKVLSALTIPKIPLSVFRAISLGLVISHTIVTGWPCVQISPDLHPALLFIGAHQASDPGSMNFV